MPNKLDEFMEQDIALINACIAQERKQARILVISLAIAYIIGGCLTTVKVIKDAHGAQLEVVQAWQARMADAARTGAGAGVSVIQEGEKLFIFFLK